MEGDDEEAQNFSQMVGALDPVDREESTKNYAYIPGYELNKVVIDAISLI